MKEKKMVFKRHCCKANDRHPNRAILREWASQRTTALRARISWFGDELVQASQAVRCTLLKVSWVVELLEPERLRIFSAESAVKLGASGGRD